MEAERSLKREGTARNFPDVTENASEEDPTTRGQPLYDQALAGIHTDAHPDKTIDLQTRGNPELIPSSPPKTGGRSPQVPGESCRSHPTDMGIHTNTYRGSQRF